MSETTTYNCSSSLNIPRYTTKLQSWPSFHQHPPWPTHKDWSTTWRSKLGSTEPWQECQGQKLLILGQGRVLSKVHQIKFQLRTGCHKLFGKVMRQFGGSLLRLSGLCSVGLFLGGRFCFFSFFSWIAWRCRPIPNNPSMHFLNQIHRRRFWKK